MGSAGLTKSKSLERFFPNFRPEDWEVAQSNQRDGNSRYGQLTTLRNKITCNEIDKYQLSFSSDREQRIYEECFMQRLREEFLVNAFHYQPLRTSGICSSVKGAVVYIQHIPVRLCDFDDIPLHESLYIIKCALLGFEKLYNESGYFQVMEEHIGVDKLGRIKVWLNADLSKNYPFCFQEDLHQTKDSERVMVQEIINLIQKSTNFQEPYLDQYQVPMPLTPPLSQFMKKYGFAHASFRQAVEAINQYCLKYKIELPKKCGSIIRIFRQQIVGDNQGDDNDDFDGNGQTCDEQYLNRLEVEQVEQEQAGNQYNSAINTQANQREGENNMENSRAKNEIKHNIASGARPVSGQENVSEVQHMSYKQYQPISIYKPNHMKNSGMSASVGSETSRNNRERIKLKSHRSSISGSRPGQTNSNKNLPELNFVQNHNRSSQISQKSNASKHSRHSNNGNFNNEAPLMPGKSINGPDLYGNKSSQSSNFYKQIGDDFNRICSNQSSNPNSNSNSARSSQQVPHVYQPYGGQHYGNQQYITQQYNPQQILQVNHQQTLQANVQSGIELRQEFGVNPKQGALSNRSNNSHNNSSRNSHSSPNTYNNQNSQNNINNHNSRISNPDFQAAPVCRQQLQNSRAERALTGSSASSRSQLQSHIVRNGNIPKISFSYNSRRDNIQYNSQKQKPNIQAISQNIIDNAQMNGQKKRKNNVEVEQQFRKDLEQQLKKRRGGSINRISQQAFKKKSLDVPEKIIEAKQEDEIDPQIMQDLLRMESKGQVC